MAKTLIESPFPSTAEVARKLGVSHDRVRKVERMVFRDSVSGRLIPRKANRKTAKTTPRDREKLPPAHG
jgi:hypothetical protein